MENKRIIIPTVILIILLLAGVVYTFAYRDNQGPTITIEERSMSYREGEDTSYLLEGVSAYDDRSGDVTDSLVIESIIPFADRKSAEVVYAARDIKNNISVASRKIAYEELPRAYADEEEKVEEETSVSAKADDEDKKIQSVTPRPKPIVTVTPTPEPPSTAEELEEEDRIEEEEREAEDNRQREEEDARRREEREQRERERREREDEEVVANVNHSGSVKLTTNSTTIHVGDSFNPAAYVASATIDGMNVIGQMHISSKVDTSKAGEYVVAYAAYLADGYTTDVQILNVKVE